MIVFLLVAVSTVPLIVLVMLLRWSASRHSRPRNAILGATLLHEIVLVVLPVWHSAATGFANDYNIGMGDPEELLAVMIGEAIFVMAFAFALTAARRDRSIGSISLRRAKPDRLRNGETTALFILLVIALFAYLPQAIDPLAAILISNPALSWLNDQAMASFGLTALAGSTMLVIKLRHRGRAGARMILYVILCCSIVIAGVSSSKGMIVWMLSTWAVIAYLLDQGVLLRVSVVVLLVATPLITFLGGDFRSEQQLRRDAGTSTLDLAENVVDNTDRLVSDVGAGSILNFVGYRGEGPRNSTVLYYMRNSEGPPGLRIYVGSLLFPVPRFMWENKPTPGSPYSDRSGSAIFAAHRTHKVKGQMGPVLASAHAYWEFGWPGVVILGLATGILWRNLLAWADASTSAKGAIVIVGFSAALLTDGFLTALSPMYAYLLAVWRVLVPVWLLFRMTDACSRATSLPCRHGQAAVVSSGNARRLHNECSPLFHVSTQSQ